MHNSTQVPQIFVVLEQWYEEMKQNIEGRASTLMQCTPNSPALHLKLFRQNMHLINLTNLPD